MEFVLSARPRVPGIRRAPGALRRRLIASLLLGCLPASMAHAQPPQASGLTRTNDNPSPAPIESPKPKVQPQEEKLPRIFWIIPTYKVTESKTPTTLTPRRKLGIVINDLADPYTIGFTAFTAGIAQTNNDMAGYGQGAQGYAKRFGAGYADQATAGFFGGFLFPSLLHEDPRYYRQGSGPVLRRFTHALIRPVVTYSDAGERTFNWSGNLGALASSALSNSYYPPADRGVGKTFSRYAMGIPFSIIDHLVDEFGPDLERKFLGKKRPSDP